MKLLIGFLIFALALKDANSIKCYVCDSLTNADCDNDGFKPNSFTAKECQASSPALNITSCIKTVSKGIEKIKKNLTKINFSSILIRK